MKNQLYFVVIYGTMLYPIYKHAIKYADWSGYAFKNKPPFSASYKFYDQFDNIIIQPALEARIFREI